MVQTTRAISTVRPGQAEFDLLCAAVRPSPDAARVERILAQGIDAERLIALAALHRVQPVLSRCLARLPRAAVPARVHQALAAFERHHLGRCLAMADELLRLSAAFEDRGIRFAVFKGPVAALQLYGNLARREYADIDVIVPPSQAVEAERFLVSLGYDHEQGDQAFRRAFLRHQRQYALSRPGLDAAIDLHWAFTGRSLPFPLAPREVWAELDTLTIGNRAVPVLKPEALALVLAGHGTKEAWRRLVWVCDFALLAEQNASLDWRAIHDRAAGQGSGNAILLALAMAESLLDTTVPASLADVLRRRPRVRRTAQRLVDRLRKGALDEFDHAPLEDILLCDRRSDAFLVRATLAVLPTPSDYHWLPLPPSLWPLYYLLRPVRLMLRALSGAARRARSTLPERRLG